MGSAITDPHSEPFSNSTSLPNVRGKVGKSEEIKLLKATLKNRQSRTAELLDGELDRLKRELEVANERYDEVSIALGNERYDEVSIALGKERTAKMPQEDRAAASTADDLTASSSSFVHLDRFKDTLQENEQLKLAKAQLESRT